MRKIIFVFLSLLVISCENSFIQPTDDEVEIIIDEPVVELPIDEPTTEIPVDEPAAENPIIDEPEISVPEEIPVETPDIAPIAKTIFPKFYVPKTPYRSVMLPTEFVDNPQYYTGLGPVLVANWYTGSKLYNSGTTFSAKVLFETIVFTITNNENGTVTYFGNFSDNEGFVKIDYYPETSSFDLEYKLIIFYEKDTNIIQACYGKMTNASIDEDGGYVGDYQSYMYNRSIDDQNAQLISYKFNATSSKGTATFQATAMINVGTKMVDDNGISGYPKIYETLDYNSMLWDELLEVNSFRDATEEEFWDMNGTWYGRIARWMTRSVYESAGSNNFSFPGYTYSVDYIPNPELISEPEFEPVPEAEPEAEHEIE